jgi:hypothetical protein
MHDFEQQGPAVGLAEPAAVRLVDARALGVYAYDTYDAMGAYEPVRVLVAARSTGQAVHRVRRGGFRVHRWTPQLVQVPQAEVNRALAVPGVVIWRNHDPDLAGQWFYLPR